MKKNILITGASKGIGKEIAIGLSKTHNIFLCARNEKKLLETASLCAASKYICSDLSAKNGINAVADFILKNSIDVLINNAGTYCYSSIEEMNTEKITEIITTNLSAPNILCSAAAKVMKQKHWGRIINIGSISGVMGEAFASSYSASKAGLIGLTKALALELAQDNITVNTINPGWVETQMGQDSINESGFSLDETLESIPQKRFVEPKEIERLINYLISEDARGITGQSINVCAGLSVGI